MAKNKFIDQRFMSNGKTSPLSNKLNLKKYIQSVVDESGITPTTNTSTGKYRLSQFPETVLPKTEWVESYAGEAVDEGVRNLLGNYYIFKLDDGTLVYLSYCQSVLKNGVHIYECFELESFELEIDNPVNDTLRLFNILFLLENEYSNLDLLDEEELLIMRELEKIDTCQINEIIMDKIYYLACDIMEELKENDFFNFEEV
jgi:hypothetical protein